MNRLNFGIVIVFFVAVIAFADNNRIDVDVFGSVRGQEITNGFIFVDGRYIPPPYRISSEGVEVSVNGVWLTSVAKWPPLDFTQKEKPELSPDITENSTIYDLRRHGRHGYLARMIRYHKQNTPKNQVVPEIIEAYKALPFVVKVQRTGAETLDVTTNDGKVHHIMTGSRGRDLFLNPLTHEEVAARIRNNTHHYENTLKKNGGFFVFPGFSMHTVSPHDMKNNMPVFQLIVNGLKTLDDKISELARLKVFLIEDLSHWRSFVSNFKASPELMQRITFLGDAKAQYKRRRRQWYVDKRHGELFEEYMGKVRKNERLGIKEKLKFQVDLESVLPPDDFQYPLAQ